MVNKVRKSVSSLRWLARWLPLVPGRPEGLAVAGQLHLRAKLPRGGRVAWTLDARLDTPRGEARLEGTLDPADLLAGGPVRGTAKGEPDSIPVEVSLDGTATLRPRLRYDGTATARIEDLPAVAFSGSATQDEATATFSWDGIGTQFATLAKTSSVKRSNEYVN